MSLEALATRAVDAALKAGAGDAEAAVQDSVGREIRVFEGEVESLTEAGERGLCVRVWIDGRVGFAYGTDLADTGIAHIAEEAVSAARVSDPDEFAGAPDPAGEPAQLEGLSDPEISAWTTARKIELAQAVERACRDADDRISGVETAVYVDEQGSSALASSRGVAVEYESSFCYAYLQAIAGEGEDRETGLGFGMGRSPARLVAAAIGHEAAERATQLLGATKPKSRTCPVVLDPTVAASFAGFVGGVLCADSVQRGRSPFAGKLNESIGSEAFTLTDDGIDPEGFAAAPVDDEGYPRGRTVLVDGGRLAAYLHDTYTARREGNGAVSTASAARSGYRSPPSVGTSNLIVAAGEQSLEGLFAAAGEGMYVTDVAGLHSGVNPVSGQFSVGASGVAIEGGALGQPATEFTIASDLVSMLSAIAAAGADARWVPFGGSVKTPALLVSEMAVGGS